MKSSKSKKSNQKDTPAPLLSSKAYVIFSVIIVGVIAWGVIKGRFNRPPTESSPLASSTNASATVAQAKPDFQKLKGKWLRPDGGYIIEIKSADESGKLDAGYFNPKPIHVAKAEAKQEGSALKVFIELQDVNYPGSTYTLTYIPERDLLAGIYFQALQQQRFEVYFERTQ